MLLSAAGDGSWRRWRYDEQIPGTHSQHLRRELLAFNLFVLGGELLRDRVEPRRQFSRNSLFNCDDQIFENVTENNKYKMQKKSDFGVSFSLL